MSVALAEKIKELTDDLLAEQWEECQDGWEDEANWEKLGYAVKCFIEDGADPTRRSYEVMVEILDWLEEDRGGFDLGREWVLTELAI